jgi:integrase
MANNKVTICVRPRTGSRTPVTATGKFDPIGSYYIRWCEGSKVRYSKPMQSFDEAYAAKVTFENKRNIEALGGIVPEAAPVGPKFHRCEAILVSYLKHLRSTTKKNGRAYRESAIKARESDIRAFLEFTKRTYVEQISKGDFKSYWEHLKALGRSNETVINKFTSVCSMLRNNQVVKIKDILEPGDWPSHNKVEAHPYHAKEIDAMMKVATDEEHLLLRLFLGSGMRKSEVAHSERSDLNPVMGSISIDDKMGQKGKSNFQWQTKTVSSVRDIKISADLMRDLLARPEGLLFPNRATMRPELHLERVIQGIAERAGIKPQNSKKADWVHRLRDTFATRLMKSKKHLDRDVAHILGHSNMDSLEHYVEYCRLDSPEAIEAAEYMDPHADDRKGPVLVRKVG